MKRSRIGLFAVVTVFGLLVISIGSGTFAQGDDPDLRQRVMPSPETQGLYELSKELMDKERSLAIKERTLNDRERDLKRAEKAVEEKLKDLATLQTAVEKGLDGLDEDQEERIKKLVSMMEKMRPRDGAAVMDELDLSLSVAVLNRMNRGKAGKLLAEMKPSEAAKRAERLAAPIPLATP